MRKWIGIALLVLMVAACLNDFGRIMRAYSAVNSQTAEIASVASQAPGSGTRRTAGLAAARKLATEDGIVITVYDTSRDGVSVSTRSYVSGTLIIGPAFALWARQPLQTPFPIDAKSFSYYR
jgi:hypothetical protein